MGLYEERIGCLNNVCESQEIGKGLKSQFEHVIRCMWLAPSLYGEKIAKTVLKDKSLFEEWVKEIVEIKNRLKNSRFMLQSHLKKIDSKGKWVNLTKHKGLFVLLPFSENQIKFLIEKYNLHIVK